MFHKISESLLKNLGRFRSIVEHPRLLGTIGKGINRDFVKDLFFIQSKLGITPRTVLDIGAAVGEYSCAIRFVFPEANVYAFEPIENSYQKLERLFGSDPKVHLFNYALSRANERREFRVNEFSFSSSLLQMTERHKEVFPQTQREKCIQVQCRRLDSMSDLKIEQPALMKIDVQGAELEVLDGAAETLKKFAAVQLEVNFEQFYAGQPNYVEVMTHMYNHGFRRFIQREVVFMRQYGLTHSDLLFF